MTSISNSTPRTWWKDGTVYQIWPASYKDSNGDGVGDILGIISTLDYLKDLGVDIIWVSPMFDSPQYDMGYDISNYEDIYPKYGTLADAEKLIKECHDRGIKVIFDLVINHTSHLHAWFQESRSSKDNPKRDWYIWRPAKYDKDGKRRPPNNWRGHFGGSAWDWDEATQEYYLHLFCPEQPDLNWENETTRNAIYDSAMSFWLDRGIDGFRIDTVNMYSKGSEYPDAPIRDPDSEYQMDPTLFCNGPRMHEFLREMYTKVFSHYDCMTVGELPNTPDIAHVLRYISAKENQLNMVFQFDLVTLGRSKEAPVGRKPYKLTEFKEITASLQSLHVGNDAWTTAFLENHDLPRSISRFATDVPQYRVRAGKLLALFLAPLTGTLFLYQGQEIGMINVPRTWKLEDYKDVGAINYFNRTQARHPNDEAALAKAVDAMQHFGRDNARTPVQWDSSTHAGFTNGEPWMRVHDLYPEINVADQLNDPSSLLNFWKKMLKMRKEHVDLFVHGEFKMHDAEDENTFTYSKEFKGERIMVALNFTEKVQKMFVPKGFEKMGLLLSNVGEGEAGDLQPYEGRIYRVQ